MPSVLTVDDEPDIVRCLMEEANRCVAGEAGNDLDDPTSALAAHVHGGGDR